MNTLFLNGQCQEDIETAGEILRRGGLVAIPTETVYGLAADALNGEAVKRIYKAKGRPSDNPLIVHIHDFSQLPSLVQEVPESAQRLAHAFWPGPLTMILPKSNLVPPETSGGLSTVAVRFPSHPMARAVIKAAGKPLAAPSANLSGRPSPTTFSHVKEDLAGRVEAILDGGDCDVGVESTVITLAETPPRLLRPGGVTLSQLQAVLGEVEVDPAVLHRLEAGRQAASPGMKYKHYAPLAQVIAVDASPEDYASFVNSRQGCYALCFDEDVPGLQVPHISYGSRYNGQQQAHRLFFSLHQMDLLGAKTVYAHIPSKAGVGLAVYNRLIRAAGFSVIRPGECMVLGLTGPSGAGKSTVAALLRETGCFVIDCDALTRSAEVYDRACVRELQEAFGADVAPNGVLDRRLTAARAFATEGGKAALEAITYPRILKCVRALLAEAVKAGQDVAVLDAPTLFESGLDQACVRILTVTASEETRLSRVLQRDGVTKQEALRRFSAQPDEGFYRARADYTVENEGMPDLHRALTPVLKDLKGEA